MVRSVLDGCSWTASCSKPSGKDCTDALHNVGALKAEALVPFLSNFIKGAAAASDGTSSSSEAPSGDATDQEASADAEAGGASNDTAGERAEAPKAPVPDLYALDLDKVDTLLEEDSVWLIATYAGEAESCAAVHLPSGFRLLSHGRIG